MSKLGDFLSKNKIDTRRLVAASKSIEALKPEDRKIKLAKRAAKAEGGEKWTIPIGGGIGHIFHIGRLPVNMQVAAYYNVVRPDQAANWQIRAQVQLMFPK